MKLVPGGDNLVKGVQCYELFGGIALKNHTFSFFFIETHNNNIHTFVNMNTERAGKEVILLI